MNSTKTCKVLVAPLNWGLGHATRCIPIIHQLISKKCEVMIGANGGSLNLLQSEFPTLEFVEISGYPIEYSANKNFMSNFVLKLPEMLIQVQKEHQQLKGIIKEHNINVVISDNRYGLRSDKVKSIMITHQLNLQLSTGSTTANWMNRKLLNQFDEIWVPDYEGKENLAGELSRFKSKYLKNVKYIGPLSRFDRPSSNAVMDLDFVAIVSGPEPQRTILDKIIQNQLVHTPYSGVIVQGIPQKERYIKLRDGIGIYSHLPTSELNKLFARAKVVIARAGYTTIMELAAMGKAGILIPTPGQPEQEYLAEHLKGNNQFVFVKQKHINLTKLLTRTIPAIPSTEGNNFSLLRDAIDSFLKD